MPMDTPEQIEAFKNVALGQGYDPKEVEGFIGMAKSASASKQAAAKAAQDAEMQQYEKRLQLQNKYNPTAAEKPWSPESDPIIQRQLYLDKMKKESGGMTTGELSDAEKEAIKAGVSITKYDDSGRIIVVPKDKNNASAKVLGYAEQLMNGTSKSIKDIPAEDRGEVVQYLKANEIDIYQLQKERESKASKNLIKGLFNDYYGAGGREGGDDLSGKGWAGFGLPGLLIKGRAAIGQGRAGNYKSTKDALLASLKSITGDNGVLTDQDAERIGKLMPNPGDNPDYAARQWDKVNEILVSKYGVGIYDKPEDSPTQVKKGLNDVGKSPSPREIATQNLKNKGFSQDKIDAFLKAKGL